MSNNPKFAGTANHQTSQHTPVIAGKPIAISPVGSTNAIQIGGDMSLWDSVANKFVSVDQSTVGTTILPKL